MGEFIRHVPCVNPNCTSSDGMAMYSDGTGHCFVCRYNYFPNEEHKAKRGVKKVQQLEVKQKPGITDEQHEDIKDKTSYDSSEYRSISLEVNKFFGCRTEYTESEEVYKRYYPCTVDGKISGYKVRLHPKTFSTIGNVGNKNDLYGSFRFQAGGKYVLIVGGEEDTHAAFQMLKEYSDNKGGSFVTAVVSPTVGETSSAKQIAHNYEFLNNFENILVGFDADEAGQEATNLIISALPKGKVKIVNWSKAKDPNDYLEKGLQKQFIYDFYNAKTYVPAGVLGSDKLYDKILEQAGQKKLAFPDFMHELNEMLAGGIGLGNIVNLAAGTSIGKTTLVNEIVYYWIFNSPYKPGIVSMEADAGQYGEALLSRHISRKLALIKDENEKKNLLTSEVVKQAATELFSQDDNPRFFLVDDRDGTIEQLKDTIEQMVISSNCKIIVIDPIQDIFSGMGNDEQELFMTWCKSMIKSHNITFILINHVRKSPSGGKDNADGARLSESDIHGTSTLIKSASVNILLSRNKMSEDEIERNTTYIEVSKNRQCGLTGPAGELYYDNETHTLHNKAKYFETVNRVPTKEF